MSQYDFVKQPDRLHQHSVKWQEVEKDAEQLPMWVADMDFVALPEIKATVHAYADYGVYGYSYVPDSLLEAIQNWERKQHHYALSKEAIVLVDGVVPAIGIAIQALTNKGDAVLINTPVYPPFARTIQLNQRKLVENSLPEVDGKFKINFEQFEKQIVENHVKAYLLCNPHNPGGRVWSKAELLKIGRICQKHGVVVISDEIHQDLALFGHVHESFNTLAADFKDFAIVLSSATKTFNIAGTKCSFALIENETLRNKFLERRLANNQHEISTLGMMVTETALKQGSTWLEGLKPVLEKNIRYVVEELTAKTKVNVMQPEGTYLIWLDFSAYSWTEQILDEKLHDQAKVILNKGRSFGKEGAQHARFNAAAPFAMVKEAVDRMISVLGK